MFLSVGTHFVRYSKRIQYILKHIHQYLYIDVSVKIDYINLKIFQKLQMFKFLSYFHFFFFREKPLLLFLFLFILNLDFDLSFAQVDIFLIKIQKYYYSTCIKYIIIIQSILCFYIFGNISANNQALQNIFYRYMYLHLTLITL